MTYSNTRLHFNEGARELLGNWATEDVTPGLTKASHAVGIGLALGVGGIALGQELVRNQPVPQITKDIGIVLPSIAASLGGLIVGTYVTGPGAQQSYAERVQEDLESYVRLVGLHNASRNSLPEIRAAVKKQYNIQG